MIGKKKRPRKQASIRIKKLRPTMEISNERTAALPYSLSEEPTTPWGFKRNKRQVKKKKINMMYLFKVICASRESCLEWLKNKGFIPRIMFCPNCSKKMRFEANEEAIDGYLWICKECPVNPPKFSARHGSWLQSKDAPLVDILLFTYLWCHGWTMEQIAQETKMPLSAVQEWNVVYSTICDSLYQRGSTSEDGDEPDTNEFENIHDTPTVLWRKKNLYKDPFLEFLKDADSL